MGRRVVKVPDVGEGVAEVEVVSWAVAEGETVARNQIVAEVMTDKATVEVPCPVDGVLTGRSGSVGDRLLVGETLFTLYVEGEGDDEPDPPVEDATGAEADSPNPGDRPEPPTSDPAATGPDATSPGTSPAATTPGTNPNATGSGTGPAGGGPPVPGTAEGRVGAPRPEGRRPRASPSVRRRAREGGIDLRTVAGSGPAGRITHDDLDLVFRTPVSAPSPSGPGAGRSADPSVEDQPIIGLRRRIAEQMVASASTIPHITYVDEVDMTALEDLRAALNARAPEGVRLTILPFLIRAIVEVVADFPMCNAHVVEPDPTAGGPATLRTFGGVHVGVATQTDTGLVVPVLRHAEAHSLWSTATGVADAAAAVRNGTASASELSGSTITITSLGALGGLVTTPIINKPETTIVGVNKLAVRPVWDGERFVPRSMMNLSSSFDHRVVDGWDAARFVQAIKALLEQPALLFVDPAPPTGEDPTR